MLNNSRTIRLLGMMDKSFYKAVLAIALPVSMQGLILGRGQHDGYGHAGATGRDRIVRSSLANQFIGVFQILCTGIGMGSSIMTARFWGAKDHDSTKKGRDGHVSVHLPADNHLLRSHLGSTGEDHAAVYD